MTECTQRSAVVQVLTAQRGCLRHGAAKRGMLAYCSFRCFPILPPATLLGQPDFGFGCALYVHHLTRSIFEQSDDPFGFGCGTPATLGSTMNDDFIREEWAGESADWDDGEGFEENDSTDVLPCPACGTEVYEEAQQCPACGEYILRHISPFSGKPLWYVLLGLVGVGAVVLVLSGLLRLL